MTVSTLRRIIILSALGLVAGNATTARADAMFTVTDLGSSYTLQQDSTGTVHTVTSGDGSQTYAFEKAPVTQINQTVYPGSFTPYSITTLFQVGAELIGYSTTISPAFHDGSEQSVPFGFPVENGWYTAGGSPISDVNATGQFVGTSNVGFAAFSTPSGTTHEAGLLTADDLNQYIASNLDVYLNSATKIDDLGDIIAQGTLNGKNQYFLLSLNGPPTPAPEPTVMVTLGVGIVSLCIHRARRRTKQAKIKFSEHVGCVEPRASPTNAFGWWGSPEARHTLHRFMVMFAYFSVSS